MIFGNSGYKNLEFSFYLINKDNASLEKNFQFLHSFYAGTQWLQLKYGFIQGPNVYNVLCPGRFNLLWASVGSEITYVGKLRKNQYMFKKYGNEIKMITDDMLWPDAWKINIKIKDLTPNNFNTYANYYLNGYENSFNLIRNITNNYNETKLTNMIKKLSEISKNEKVENYIKKEFGTDFKELESNLKKQQDSLKNEMRFDIGKNSLWDRKNDQATLRGVKDIISRDHPYLSKSEINRRATESVKTINEEAMNKEVKQQKTEEEIQK